MFHFKSMSTRLMFHVAMSVLTMCTLIVGSLMFLLYFAAMIMLYVATSWDVDARAYVVERHLAEVQTSITANDIKVTNNLKSDKKLAVAFQDILYNKSIFACGIALAPDSVTNERCLIYAKRNNKGQVEITRRSKDYAYERKDYYKETAKRKAAYWSDPYTDGDARIVTFSHPLLDNDGRFLGVLCADVLLDSIANYVNAKATTSNSELLKANLDRLVLGNSRRNGAEPKLYVLSRNGYFVVPPDSTVTSSDTYETYAVRHGCTQFKLFAEQMVTRKEKDRDGDPLIEMDGEEYLVCYSYITNVGWTVATLYPTYGFYAAAIAFCVMILFYILISILILIVLIYIVVRRSTKPLKLLVAASGNIARGNFDVKLPEMNRRDEVKTLRDSFDEMRLSLKEYMEQLKETTALNERMEQDLSIASQIQIAMLPKSFPKPPEVPEISIAAFMKPAREVGGDLYDFFIRRGHLYFVIGDVSGKGVPAAMIMAVTTSMFRARPRINVEPERTVRALNNMLIERNSTDMFVTLVVGDLNLATGELNICNAGHNPPILIKDGELQMMELKTNIPIGVFQNYNYTSERFVLAKGDRLLLYTDGVTEANNSAEDLFGENRLLSASRKYGKKEVENFVNSMVNDLQSFIGETPQSDDITLMALEYHGSQNIVSRELQFTNDINEVTRISAVIEEACEQLSVDPATCSSMQLAVEEAVVNVITYAYENGRANINNHFKITSDGKTITFTLTDNGMPFDPTKAAMPDTTLGAEQRGIGGLGILLVKKLMDEVTYKRIINRNILIMTKALPTTPTTL